MVRANDAGNSRISEGTGSVAVGRIDPMAMTVAQAARVLSAAGGVLIAEDAIRRHVASGAPASADGKINLVHYAAWLNREREDHAA